MAFIVYASSTPERESKLLDIELMTMNLEDRSEELCANIGSMILQAQDLLLGVVSLKAEEL